MVKMKENSEADYSVEKLDIVWLYARGYTLRAAGKLLGVTGMHIGKVLRGERESKPLLERLRALPQREPVKALVVLPEFR